jgi:hypothetical protein
MEDSFFDGKRGRLRGSKVLTVEETGMENTLYADGRTPGRPLNSNVAVERKMTL